MVKSGLTEKRMQDKRFRRTEDAILVAVIPAKEELSVAKIVKDASISRSTFYRHHRTVQSIVSDYETYIIKQFLKLINRWNQNQRLSVYYEQTLLFINANKIIVGFLLEHGESKVIEKMVKVIEPMIIKIYRIPKNRELMLAVYRKEVLGIIEEWKKNDFESEAMKKVLGNIMYLTESLRGRLIQLEN